MVKVYKHNFSLFKMKNFEESLQELAKEYKAEKAWGLLSSIDLHSCNPDYIREEYPLFVVFIQKFLEFLESQDNDGNLILKYQHFIDIDKLDEKNTIDKLYLDKYANQYLNTFPVYKLDGLNLKTLIILNLNIDFKF
jgi:hypothetical protein